MCGNNNDNNNNNNNLHAGTPKLQYFLSKSSGLQNISIIVVVIRSYMVLEKLNLNLIMTINACGHE